ncbi:hypothetical protein LTR20_007376 [Exophiala xenobiotica]|nr:hypothetical protein LTS06_008029 [Exophiala xenobiotica]KAK5283491.1 hypothetical protein LTR40_001634 [Exophiala xenobiotica]KAK5367232.1 hypothetical protein LTS13_008085 [Exophiala xenobiotica]KAK5401239.1 hypothetical protein LTR79_001758 [Exophiala xenobiotica]KAK5405944.1 hypothetical protein LTR90_010755 [Exophiala xenobiotica]
MADFRELLGSALSWKLLAFLFICFNVKCLPFVWHIRFLRTFFRRLTDPAPSKNLSPQCLFLPAITSTRSPLLECDYNLHKSNSTYFTDLDMSRGNICLLLFGKAFNPFPGPAHLNIVLGSACCVWRREIKPYQRYELWTRILSWDEKWIYLVTHFVEAGRFKPARYILKPGSRRTGGSKEDRDASKGVFASSVARYVFKNGRQTVPPEQVLRQCGLLHAETEDDSISNGPNLLETESQRQKWLPVAQLHHGWDAIHALFKGEGSIALGRYAAV